MAGDRLALVGSSDSSDTDVQPGGNLAPTQPLDVAHQSDRIAIEYHARTPEAAAALGSMAPYVVETSDNALADAPFPI